jgi:hypothetical protein
MACPCPEAKPKCMTCPRTTLEVRASLALFGATSFLMGMGFFMFLLCSSSAHHLYHLRLLVTDPAALLWEHNHDETHFHTAD